MELQLRGGELAATVQLELPGLFLGHRHVRAAFLGRVRGVHVDGSKPEVMARLRGPHRLAAQALGLGEMRWVEAEQVHGAEVAVVEGLESEPVPGADALVTQAPGVCLVIAVADCAAVFLVENSGKAIGLAHSGKKGTEAEICRKTVQTMVARWGCEPQNLSAYISPCIRPPFYEVDFARDIQRQLQAEGVGKIVDSGVCTASHPHLYYSYRRERGQTGRMLALLAIAYPANAVELER